MTPDGPVPDTLVLRLPEHVLTRGVGDETVLLNLDSEQYYGVDGVGARVVELIRTGTPFGGIVDTLLDEYATDAVTLRNDLETLVADLRQNGLVELDEP